MKYSPTGTTVRVQIVGRAGNGPGSLVSEVAVTDEGPGMAAADRGRAFDQFFRGAQARRMVPNGSGIGLYAVRGLVEAMRGAVDLETIPGKGTTVRVTLPADPAEAR